MGYKATPHAFASTPLTAVAWELGRNQIAILPEAAVLDLIWIAPGTFRMGSAAAENGGQKWEMPQTEVTISKGFWLGKTPVTQGQYFALMGTNPSQFVSVGKDAPVEQVSWNDAFSFCERLTAREKAAGRLPKGYIYTLPTEAQWEYACRASSTEPRYGNLDDIAWYRGNSGGTTHPVAKKLPNAWGLYDMIGNVWEWCSDEWTDNYAGGSVVDPTGPATGPGRVGRGGSFSRDAGSCRAAARGKKEPATSYNYLGFRVALRWQSPELMPTEPSEK